MPAVRRREDHSSRGMSSSCFAELLVEGFLRFLAVFDL